MFQSSLKTIVLASACLGVFALFLGCPRATNECGDLVNGQFYEVEIQVLDADGEDVECEQEGEHEGENEGCGGLYALEIEQEGGDDDNEECEQEGEHEGENEGCDGEGEEQAGVSAQVTAIAEDLSSFELLGALTVVVEADAEVEIAIEDIDVGTWVEVEGEIGTDGLFHASELEPADEQEIEIEGVISNVTDTSFTILGLTVTYDDNTELECGDDEDDDDEECEQEGEHEGENEGC